MREAVVGIDVGGTRIKAALVTPAGEVLAQATHPTPADVGTSLGLVIADIVNEIASRDSQQASGMADPAIDVLALGVAVPGVVDEAVGLGVWSANLGWRDLDLRSAVSAHVDRPVAIGHDVRCGLRGEHRFGAARGVDDVLFVPVGTGLASALLCHGHLVIGSAWTGELGHVVVAPDGPLCGCGQRGCVEAVSSAAAIARRWAEESGQAGDAVYVAGQVAAGEPLATRIWQEAIDALAVVMAPVIAAAGTQLVLVGGGLAQAGNLLLDPLRAQLRSRLGGRDVVTVGAAALGDRAGAMGAAALALAAVSR